MRFLPLIILGLIGALWAGSAPDLVNVASMKRPPLEEIRYPTTYQGSDRPTRQEHSFHRLRLTSISSPYAHPVTGTCSGWTCGLVCMPSYLPPTRIIHHSFLVKRGTFNSAPMSMRTALHV